MMDNRHNGGPPLNEDVAPAVIDGWVAISRALRNHEVVGFGQSVEPASDDRGFCFSKAEAWIDLIMECRYRDGTVTNNGKVMDLKVGQLLGAFSWLAHRWNWTPKTVRVFLERLERYGMISRFSPGTERETRQCAHHELNETNHGTQKGKQKGKQWQVISICNYSQYQVPRFLQGHAEGHAQGFDEGTQGARKGHARGMNLTKEQGNKETIDNMAGHFDGRERASDLASGGVVRHDPATLSKVLVDAAGDALDNPVNCLGLASCAIPLGWLEAGCDLDRDILPTMRGFAMTAKGRAIRSWNYFTGAVMRARDQRRRAESTSGAPAVGAGTLVAGPLAAEGWEVTDRGRVNLSNGARAEWLERFGGNAQILENALIEVSGKLKLGAGSPSIEQQVESHLARVSNDVMIRERNTVIAVERRAKPQISPVAGVSGSGQVESRADRFARYARAEGQETASQSDGAKREESF